MKMPENDINMEEFWQEVQSEIDYRGFVVYPNFIITSDHKAYWPKEKGVVKFLDLAQELERKVIYAYSSKFDSEDALDLLLISAPSDFTDYDVETVRECLRLFGVESSEEAKEYLKTTKFYEGRRVSIWVEWVFEGIIHTYTRKPGWYTDITELAGRIIDLSESLAYERSLF
jgi:hypothetical protein